MDIIKTTGRFTFERPKIEIADHLYPIDDRKSNIDKLQVELNKPENAGKEDQIVITALIGKDGFEAVQKLDLGVADYSSLIVILQSIVYRISEEEAQKRFLSRL